MNKSVDERYLSPYCQVVHVYIIKSATNLFRGTVSHSERYLFRRIEQKWAAINVYTIMQKKSPIVCIFILRIWSCWDD